MTKNDDGADKRPPVELVWEGKDRARSILDGPTPLLVNEFGVPEDRVPSLASGEHLVVVGDNGNVLLNFLRQADLRFDFIYIDPPYNTGQQFTFRDAVANHSVPDPSAAWLTFMYPRLLAAHGLLCEEGFFFASIDDREFATLFLILSEIFGKENHVATLKWRKKRKPSFLDRHLASVIEYVIIFAKNGRKAPKLLGDFCAESTRPVLNAGNRVVERVLRQGTRAACPDGNYPIGMRMNRTLSIELMDEARVRKGVLENEVRIRGQFRVSQEVLDSSVYITPQFGLRRHVAASEKKRKHASDDCTNWPTNEDAEAELRAIFGRRIFDFPKPVNFLRNLLSMCPQPENRPMVCLDFFAGSGTFGEAVLAQNEADGGRRHFICVQSQEPMREEISDKWGRRFRHVSDITVARSQYAIGKYGGSLRIWSCQPPLGTGPLWQDAPLSETP